jgi:4-aminobutyrate aminotransferase-like enzyme/Ser/Thr protein kinase RdoA (MazF antagonist)
MISDTFVRENIKFLDSDVPNFSADAAAQVVRELYGIEGAFSQLYSERDQNFRVRTTDGADYVLKFANSEEDPGVLDMQHQALAHVEARDPELPVPRVIRNCDGAMSGAVDDADGKAHIVRLLSFMPGIDLVDARLTSKVLRALGATTARLDKALRSFFHPSADHVLLWDLKRLPDMRHNTAVIKEPGQRRKIEAVIDHFADHILPLLGDLRWQIIHNDANSSNVLVAEDDPERIAGIIDYGDMVHAPLICEVAIAAAGIFHHSDDPVSAICDVAAGFDGVVPLEAEEVDLIYDLVIARVASEFLICTWRIANPTGPIEYLKDCVAEFWPAFDRLLAAGRETVRARLRGALKFPPYCPRPGEVDQAEADAVLDEMLERRRGLLGHKLDLFYDRPLHMVRGEGVWLYDATGRAYLDAYNNVPHVGHSHPHVLRSITRQYAALCTNTRYVYGNIIDYAERLAATFTDGPRVCVFVNSGSEATDISWRMAKMHSGKSGAIVIEKAYHGGTDAIDAFSPADRPGDEIPGHIRTIVTPDTYRGEFRGDDAAARYAADADRAIAELNEAGYGVGAVMIESSFVNHGVLDIPTGYLKLVVDKVRAAGGVFIADEVQAGFGRMGSHMWSCQVRGVEAEIVALGKPIGNGLALGAIMTTPEILASFTEKTGYFSTFGGNPVACAAGSAVLDVIEDDQLLANAIATGDYLRQGLRVVAQRHPMIGDVRGMGMIAGVELVRDRVSQEPAKQETKRVINAMKEKGVLVGREGYFGNVLKIRPPMVFKPDNADFLIAVLDEAVAAI